MDVRLVTSPTEVAKEEGELSDDGELDEVIPISRTERNELYVSTENSEPEVIDLENENVNAVTAFSSKKTKHKQSQFTNNENRQNCPSGGGRRRTASGGRAGGRNRVKRSPTRPPKGGFWMRPAREMPHSGRPSAPETMSNATRRTGRGPHNDRQGVGPPSLLDLDIQPPPFTSRVARRGMPHVYANRYPSSQSQGHDGSWGHARPRRPADNYMSTTHSPPPPDRPDPENDPDYIDLLMEYKLIQKQLESIKQEEERSAQLLSGSELSPASGVSMTEVDHLISANITAVGQSAVKSEDRKTGKDSSVGTAGSGAITTEMDDDEDLDELELRQLALASAARANQEAQMKITSQMSDNTTKPMPPVTSHRPSPAATTRPPQPASNKPAASRGRQSTRSSSANVTRRGLSAVEKRRENRRRRSLEKQQVPKKQRYTAQDRQRDELARQRSEAQKILTLDDPEEQVQRFLDMVSRARSPNSSNTLHHGRVNRSRSRSWSRGKSKSPSTFKIVQSPNQVPVKSKEALLDNYDEVEMDIDSSPESPSMPDSVQGDIENSEFQENLDQMLPSVDSLSGIPLPPPPPPPPLPPEEEDKPPPPNYADINEEDDEAAELRASLLQSLKQKKTVLHDLTSTVNTNLISLSLTSDVAEHSPKTAVQESPDISAQSGVTAPTRPKKAAPSGKKQRTTAGIHPPQHKPVVINIGDDSDSESASDEDDASNSAAPFLADAFQGSLDQFLKEARLSAQANFQSGKAVVKESETKAPQTMASLKHLSKQHVQMLKKAKPDTKSADISRQQKGQMHNKESVVKLEKEVNKKRNLIAQEFSKISLVANQMSKRKAQLHLAEQNAQTLQEQLAAVQKIITSHREHIDKLNRQAQILRKRRERNGSQLSTMETQLLEAGRLVHGAGYQPPTSVPAAHHSKQTKQVTKNQEAQSQKSKDRVTAQPAKILSQKASIAPRKMNAAMLSKEKQRLQQLEKEYAEKIRTLKSAQARKAIRKELRDYQKRKLSQSEVRVSDLIQGDKISIEDVLMSAASSEVDEAVIKKPRRRSLIDMSSSCKPQLAEHKAADTKPESSGKKESSEVVLTDSNSTNQRNTTVSNSGTSMSKIVVEISNAGANQTSDLKMPTGVKLEKLISSQKEKCAKIHFTDTSFRDYCPIQSFPQPLTPVPGLALLTKCKNKVHAGTTQSGQDLHYYKSMLLNYRSYRFSPYFRTKERQGLLSATYTNKLHPGRVLCRFDLTGTCNDHHCPWQHQSDWTMSNTEILADIVSYWPQVAGVGQNTTPVNQHKMIMSYAENFIKANPSMSVEELCVLLSSRINQQAKHAPPHTVFKEPRKWRPQAVVRPTKQEKRPDSEFQFTVQKDLPQSLRGGDDIISEQDVRYFMISGKEIEDMESLVLDNPQDTHLWLKLAYKKLRDQVDDSGVDHALSVLARALEANKDNIELWSHYLHIYLKRKDTADVVQLCQQAINYAPSYDIYRKYLGLVDTFSKKDEICKDAVNFLITKQSSDKEKTSHCLLELTLYRVSLHLQTGKLKTAIQLFQNAIKLRPGKSQSIAQHMTVEDCGIAWLAYIHLAEFHSLPSALYDPCDHNFSTIVNKDPFLFPWNAKMGTKTSSETLKTLFSDALKAVKDKCTANDDVIRICLPLYRNLFVMYLASSNNAASKTLCRELVTSHPEIADLWIILAQLEGQSDASQASKVYAESLEKNPFCAKLYYSAAIYAVSQGQHDHALECVEKCCIRQFDVHISDFQSCDPNLLYCKLLDQSLPLNYKCPAQIPDAVSVQSDDQQLYLWLNYCLLLELQGDTTASIEAYETVLYTLPNTKHVQCVWKSYLKQCLSHLSGRSRPADVQSAVFLVDRCLKSMPCKFLVPYSATVQWLDYSFHTDVISLLVQCVPDDHKLTTLEHYVNMMPDNSTLMIRAVQCAVERGDEMLARGFCTMFLQDHPACLPLAKILLSLLLRQGEYKLARKLYQRTVRSLPYLTYMWKELLLFEITRGSQESVKQVLGEALQRGINLQDFCNNILK